MLLVFEREDAQSDAWIWACRKLVGRPVGTDLSHSSSHSSASSHSETNHQHLLIRSFQPELVQRKMADIDPNLIIIDRRSPSRARDADALCRWPVTQSTKSPMLVVVLVLVVSLYTLSICVYSYVTRQKGTLTFWFHQDGRQQSGEKKLSHRFPGSSSLYPLPLSRHVEIYLPISISNLILSAILFCILNTSSREYLLYDHIMLSYSSILEPTKLQSLIYTLIDIPLFVVVV